MKYRYKLIVSILVAANVVTLYFLFDARRELRLWSYSAAGFPSMAGSCRAEEYFERGQICLFEIVPESASPRTPRRVGAFIIRDFVDVPEEGHLARTADQFFVSSFNKRMRELVETGTDLNVSDMPGSR